MPVDKNEAPKGFKAKKWSDKKGRGCSRCHFLSYPDMAKCNDPLDGTSCTSTSRKDGEEVIFVKRKEK